MTVWIYNGNGEHNIFKILKVVDFETVDFLLAYQKILFFGFKLWNVQAFKNVNSKFSFIV